MSALNNVASATSRPTLSLINPWSGRAIVVPNQCRRRHRRSLQSSIYADRLLRVQPFAVSLELPICGRRGRDLGQRRLLREAILGPLHKRRPAKNLQPGRLIQVRIVDRALSAVSRSSSSHATLVLSKTAFEAIANPSASSVNVEFVQV
ncbi:uncharacterized protein J3R85_001438 [Psidium guajava]|nr:uncharacterized protein J3R85_001438 [Psidium guajava]